MVLWKLHLFSLFLVVNTDMMDFLHQKTIRIYKFEGTCSGYEKVPMVMRNIRIAYSNKINVISLNVVVREPISEDFKLRLEMKRCQSREALDSCEKYQTITINHLCKLINADNKPWTPFTKTMQPPMVCPLKKGVSTVTNGTLDASSLSALPIAGWYWIVNSFVIGEKTNRNLMCVHFEGQLVSA